MVPDELLPVSHRLVLLKLKLVQKLNHHKIVANSALELHNDVEPHNAAFELVPNVAAAS